MIRRVFKFCLPVPIMAKKVNKKIEEKAKKKEDKDKDLGGLFIPAGLFIGMGVGFFTYNFVAGMFLGLGTGFLLFALVNLLKNKK